MPTCPNCQSYVPLSEMECPKCGYRTDFAEIARSDREAREQMSIGVTSVAEAEARRQAEARQALQLIEDQRRREADERVSRVCLSTSDHVPGFAVTEIVDIVSVGTILGAGVFSNLSAEWVSAKDKACRELRAQALAKGCDAVISIGTEIVTSQNTGNYLVTFTGTGVKLGPREAGLSQ